MNTQPARQGNRSLGDSARSLARRSVAAVVLFVAAIVLLKFAIGVAIGFLTSILTIVVVIAVLVGVFWALKNI